MYWFPIPLNMAFDIGFQIVKDPDIKLKELLEYLDEANILFSRVSEDSMKDKAVAKFTFELSSPASILCGSFQDRTVELTSIAHEAGHVMIHRKMNREATRNYVCIMFAANKMGVSKIAPIAQEFILEVEAEASARGVGILTKVGIEQGELRPVKKIMSRWYASYENQCRENVVKKVRAQIIQGKNPAFF